MEFNIRSANRSNVRIDYFKLNRFGEVRLTEPIDFGDFSFDAGDHFRTRSTGALLSITYTYLDPEDRSLRVRLRPRRPHLRAASRRWRARHAQQRVGLRGGHLPHGRAQLRRGAFPSAGRSRAPQPAQIDRRRRLDGKYQDSHADIQFRWRKNFAFGIGYSRIRIELERAAMPTSRCCSTWKPGPELFFRASF